MADREIVAFNESTAKFTAPQAGDGYLATLYMKHDATVFIKEGAAAAADVAAYGQLWVLTATPNLLKFTDDAGTDFGLLNDAGTVPLTANWDVGAFTITGTQFISDIAGGTAPLVVTSTTVVANLNVDQVDGKDATDLLLVDGTQAMTGTLNRLVVATITANAGGGGVGSATALTADVNEISVCATGGDSVSMPTAAAGLTVTVINNGAAACDVFPDTSDDLGGGVDTAVSLGIGANITYVAYNATTWVAVT